MSATCYSDEYDDVMISGKWFLVFHHCAGIAAPGAPANKATSLLIAYNPLQPVTKNLSKFCHVLIEPGILSQDVTLAALPIRLQVQSQPSACEFLTFLRLIVRMPAQRWRRMLMLKGVFEIHSI